MTADTDGRSRRTEAVPRFLLEEVLDNAVLQRVVADHHKPRSKAEQAVGLD